MNLISNQDIQKILGNVQRMAFNRDLRKIGYNKQESEAILMAIGYLKEKSKQKGDEINCPGDNFR
jgi:hypothetical protein